MTQEHSTSSSSAAAPVATSRPSAPRSWASRSPASTSGRTPRAARRPAAPAPTSAAFRARRCCSASSTTSMRRMHFADHGIGLKDLSIDVGKMLGRKDTVVKQNNDGILYLFKKNKVSFFHGRGSFVEGGGRRLRDRVVGEPRRLSAKQVIVATGSNARALPGAPFDEEQHPQQRRRAAHRRGAEEAGRDRLRRDRARDGLGLAPPGRRGHRARRRCRPSWARSTSRSPRKRTRPSPSRA